MIIKGAFSGIFETDLRTSFEYHYRLVDFYMSLDLGRPILVINIHYPPWWKRRLLWFLPLRLVIEDGIAFKFKFWRGIVYMISVKDKE